MNLVDKLTKIWAPIEKLLNASLIKMGHGILAVRPKWLVHSFNQFKSWLILTRKSVKAEIVKSNKKAGAFIFLQISKILNIKNVASKSIDRVLKVIKNIKPKDLKDNFAMIGKSIILVPINYYKNQPLKRSLASTIAVSFFLWGAYNIHYSKKLYDQHSKVSRSIASTDANHSLTESYKKPDYHLKRLKTLQLTNVQLPVFFSKVNEYKTINVDFSIISSNKHIVIFLDEKEELLRDHLMMNVEQVLPEFLVGTAGEAGKEGKEIIRKKIIRETNIFLEKYNVAGSIEEVRVGNILANP